MVAGVIMIKGNLLILERGKKRMNISRWVQKDNRIYFKNFQGYVGTYYYDLNEDRIDILPENRDRNEGMSDYFAVCQIEQNVVFIPYYGRDFVIYNIKDNSFKYLQKKENVTYRSCVQCNGKLWVFPEESIRDVAILIVDEMSLYYPFKEDKDDCCFNLHSDVSWDGEAIYCCTKEEGTVVKIDTNNYGWEKKKVGSTDTLYATIIKVPNGFYLSGEEDNITYWAEDGKVEKYRLPEVALQDEEKFVWHARFSDCIMLNDFIIFAPLYCRSVISFNVNTKEMKAIYNCDKGIHSWGLSYFRDKVHVTLRDVETTIKSHLLLDENGAIETNLFNLPEDIDLCFLGYEFSENALKTFIKKLVNS